MAKSATPQVVRSYLSQLKDALADLPAEVRNEIVAGIGEELDGLNAAAAATRIETLGDPEFIAAEARAEAAVVVPAGENQQASRRHRPHASWYAPVTVLLIIGGGFVVPVIGWVVGVTMLWAADVWSTRDKWLGTLAGPVAALIPAALLIVARMWLPMSGGGFDPFLLIVLSGLVLPTVANVLVGIRLLQRSKGAAAGGAASGG